MTRFAQSADKGFHADLGFNNRGFVALEADYQQLGGLADIPGVDVSAFVVAARTGDHQGAQTRGACPHEPIQFGPLVIRRKIQISENGQVEARNSIRMGRLHKEVSDAQERNVRLPDSEMRLHGVHHSVEIMVRGGGGRDGRQNQYGQPCPHSFPLPFDASTLGMPNWPPSVFRSSAEMAPEMSTMVSSLGSASITIRPPAPPSLEVFK